MSIGKILSKEKSRKEDELVNKRLLEQPSIKSSIYLKSNVKLTQIPSLEFDHKD